MRARLLFLLMLCIVAGAVIAVKVLVIDKNQAQVGSLQIATVPETTVFIDAQAQGRTPLNQSFTPGEYQIKLIPLGSETEASLPAGQAGSSAVTWAGKVRVYPRQTTYVRRELANTEIESAGEVLTIRKSDSPGASGTGDIEVQTEPQGAIVTLDGKDVGVSPHIIRGLLTGSHEVSVYLPKFKRRSIQVNVEPGGYTTVASYALGLDVDFDKKFELARAFEASGSARLPAGQAGLPTLPTGEPTPTPQPIPKGVEILETPTGFLRVRTEASLGSSELARVKPGEKYDYLESTTGWVKIKVSDTVSGWVSEEFVKKMYASDLAGTPSPTVSR